MLKIRLLTLTAGYYLYHELRGTHAIYGLADHMNSKHQNPIGIDPNASSHTGNIVVPVALTGLNHL